MSAADVAVVERCIAAINDGDVETLASLSTADVEIRPLRAALEDTAYHGRDGIERWIADLRETWADLRIEVEEVSEPTPGRVVALATLHARGQGSDVPAHVQLAMVAHMRDGLVAHATTELDREAALGTAAGEG